MAFNLKENITSLEDSKLLAELGVMKGVKSDMLLDYHYQCPHCKSRLEDNYIQSARYDKYDYEEITCIVCGGLIYIEELHEYVKGVRAYRLDKLLSVLPQPINLFYDSKPGVYDKCNQYLTQIQVKRTGQPAIKACVQLIKLLKEEFVYE